MPITGDGIAYGDVGAGDTLVFLHGVTLDRRMWDAQVAAFSPRYRCLAVDRRGHGDSAPLTDGYSVAHDLVGVLDAAGVDRCHLVGLSLGGHDAVQFAGLHPSRVRSLALVGAWLPAPAAAGWTPAALPVRRQGLDAMRAAWLADPLFTPAYRDPAVAASIHTMVSANDMALWRERIRPADEPSAVDLVPDLTMPTAVMVGALDAPPFLDLARWLHASIPGAAPFPPVVIRDAGHMAPMERPPAFNAALAAFLDTTGSH